MTPNTTHVYQGMKLTYIKLERLLIGTALVDHYRFKKSDGGSIAIPVKEWDRNNRK